MSAVFAGRSALAALLAMLTFGAPLTRATPIDIPIVINGPPSNDPTPTPPPQCSLTLNPSAATIPSTTPKGTVVSQIIVTNCTGLPTFGMPYFDDGGLFAISGSNIVISQQGPGVAALENTTQNATITVGP